MRIVIKSLMWNALPLGFAIWFRFSNIVWITWLVLMLVSLPFLWIAYSTQPNPDFSKDEEIKTKPLAFTVMIVQLVFFSLSYYILRLPS